MLQYDIKKLNPRKNLFFMVSKLDFFFSNQYFDKFLPKN